MGTIVSWRGMRHKGKFLKITDNTVDLYAEGSD